MANIFLVGFMGAGKTTVGRLLAERLEVRFVDLDEVIVERLGMPIAAFFESRGEVQFRAHETDALRELAEAGPAVVATGGGCFCRLQNREIIHSDGGVSVYLEVPWQEIRRRLAGSNGERPLFRDESAAQALLGERQAAYGQARLTLHLTGAEAPEEVADRAARAISEVECAI